MYGFDFAKVILPANSIQRRRTQTDCKEKGPGYLRPFSLQIGTSGLAMIAVVVIAMVSMVVVVVSMVFAVPMASVHLPATVKMVVVRMTPVGSRVGWPLPNPGDPYIAAAAWSPIAINPGVAFSGHLGPYLITNGRRRRADVNLYLAECWNCQGRCCEDTT
jgi:hypothetical protein